MHEAGFPKMGRMDNRRQILDRFGQQADRFERRGSTVANRDHLRWAASFLELAPGMLALDVAGGTGLMGRAIAPSVHSVVVIDLTPQMLLQARAAAANEQLENVLPLRGDAGLLPFADGAFHLAMSRYSLHHIPKPATIVAEMARVTRPGGQVAIIDLVAPDAPELARSYNRLEKLRDPSHERALQRHELETMLSALRLRVTRSGSRDIEVDLEDWLGLAVTPPAAAEQIRRLLLEELAGGPPTGMRPLRRDALLFTQTAVTLVAIRS